MIAIVDAGSGNLRSVEKALQAVGAEVRVTSDPKIAGQADRLIVPGQGAFRDCMQGLAQGLAEVVCRHIEGGKPYLGICLGLQILFTESAEQGPCKGLGILPGRVVRFPNRAGVKIPHMGWNQVRTRGSSSVPRDGEYYYFVHSYFPEPADPASIALECDYGGTTFCAAVRKENLVATQFHPEKSQRAGLRLLEWFLDL